MSCRCYDEKENAFYEKIVDPKAFNPLSSMSVLSHEYKKDNKCFTIGLYERDKPETLIYSRPTIFQKLNGKIYQWAQCNDDVINRILNTTNFEEIEQINKRVIYEYIKTTEDFELKLYKKKSDI